jgi:UDP-N-acetylglucosamine/UDP-N-acetylgalactosamine 4-epimerase
MSDWLADPRHADLRAALAERRRTWLVTGAAGFIGSNLVETLLGLGQHVRGLDNFSTGRRSNFVDVRQRVGEEKWKAFEFIEGDIRDLETCRRAVDGVDIVLHQAALGSVPRSVNDPLSSFASNVSGFLNVFEASRTGGQPRIVYASSSSVYGDAEALPKREAKIGNPLSPYAATKYIDEVIAGVMCRTYGLGSVGLRYFNVFGARQDPDGPYAAVIPKWIARMLEGESVEIYGDGETSRDFCFIANTVQANLRAALINFDGSHRVYNVALGGRATLNDLFAAIREGLKGLGHRYSREAIYRDFRPCDVRHSQADVSAIVEGIGFVPQVHLADGIARTLDWYVEACAPIERAAEAHAS